MKPVEAVVVGAGSRGNCYAEYAKSFPEKLKIVGVAEPRDFYRNKMARDFNVPQSNVYSDWKELAERGKFADVAIIATPDKMHVEPAVMCAEQGYHMLLEKPLAPTWADCKKISDAVKKKGNLFCVCHVLRYTDYTKKVKELIDSGLIGEIVSVQHLEPVGYWHQAHSFVRGNWGNTAESSFMLLQKCCHDVDWINYVVGSDCKEVSSFGNLKHFKSENKPDGAGDRCTSCAVEKECPYSAVKIYIRERAEKEAWCWPLDAVTSDLTLEGVKKALETGPYGRCVYECDNDVVDHQVVNMLFENGVTVSFTMTAFSELVSRKTTFFGTKGQLYGDGETLVHYDFLTNEKQEFFTGVSDGGIGTGHGGGDYGIMRDFVSAVQNNDASEIKSGLEASMKSHLAVFAAEQARLQHDVVKLSLEGFVA